MSIRNLFVQIFAIVTLVAVSSSPLRAAVYYWDPNYTSGSTGGGNGTWNTTNANWWNGSTDVTWANGNDACFSSNRYDSAMLLPSLAQATTVGNLTFTGASTYVLQRQHPDARRRHRQHVAVRLYRFVHRWDQWFDARPARQRCTLYGSQYLHRPDDHSRVSVPTACSRWISRAGAPTNNIINPASPLVLGGLLEVMGSTGVSNSQTFNGTTVDQGLQLGRCGGESNDGQSRGHHPPARQLLNG